MNVRIDRIAAIIVATALCFWPGTLVCQTPAKILTVIIDPGHGGLDNGGKGPGGVLEKDIALTLASKLAEVLQEAGAVKPVLTRKDDYAVSLDDRAGLANHHRGDLLVSLHLGNSFRPVPAGFSLFYWSPAMAVPDAAPTTPGKTPWDQEQRPFWEQSRELAELMQQELLSTLTWPSGEVMQADLYLIRRVRMPAVLVELGSLNHPREASDLQKQAFQEAIARALGTAIERYAQMK
jgi:N-acetylmuramoyl-L-alanine amidase